MFILRKRKYISEKVERSTVFLSTSISFIIIRPRICPRRGTVKQMRLAELQKRRYFHPGLARKFTRKSSATQLASPQSRLFTFSSVPRRRCPSSGAIQFSPVLSPSSSPYNFSFRRRDPAFRAHRRDGYWSRTC